nr:putative glycoside hydrolase [Acetivibrio straminisolvens]
MQDFTASWLGKGYYQSYGPKQVREQIQAVYDAGYEEWIFWDANNTYSEEAFLKE